MITWRRIRKSDATYRSVAQHCETAVIRLWMLVRVTTAEWLASTHNEWPTHKHHDGIVGVRNEEKTTPEKWDGGGKEGRCSNCWCGNKDVSTYVHVIGRSSNGLGEIPHVSRPSSTTFRFPPLVLLLILNLDKCSSWTMQCNCHA
jgi:hypothetical protein